jgi:hypothetical protein
MPSPFQLPTIRASSCPPSIASRSILLGAVASRQALRATFRIGVVLATTLLLACSARSAGTGAAELPASCNAFVTKYEACTRASVPSMPELAKKRAAQTRASLETQAAQATAEPGHDIEALATECQNQLQRLTASCDPSLSTRTN